jgi:large conductance mechanosensitive channel
MREKKIKKDKKFDHRGLIAEFKEFALQGNVMDMAIAAVIGVAFGKIVTAIVNNIIALLGSLVSLNFEKLIVKVHGVPIEYGVFIQDIVDFIIIAIILFFAVKFINLFRRNKNDAADCGAEDKPDDKADEK